MSAPPQTTSPRIFAKSLQKSRGTVEVGDFRQLSGFTAKPKSREIGQIWLCVARAAAATSHLKTSSEFLISSLMCQIFASDRGQAPAVPGG